MSAVAGGGVPPFGRTHIAAVVREAGMGEFVALRRVSSANGRAVIGWTVVTTGGYIDLTLTGVSWRAGAWYPAELLPE